MTTVSDLLFEEELAPLRETATARGWNFDQLEERRFALGLPARDGQKFWLLVDCDRYRAEPPAWHWYDPESKRVDQPCDTPKGTGFLHNSGRICAPWNRLAYQSCDPKGPHGDWQLANWASNPKTGGCTMLAAMALRLFVELNSERYAQSRLE